MAEALLDEAEKVDRAVRYLIDAAASGDLAACKVLIPYFDQALGRPQERVQHTTPDSLEALEGMETSELERLVAQGRARRLGLRVAPEPAPDPPAGVGDDAADVASLLPRAP